MGGARSVGRVRAQVRRVTEIVRGGMKGNVELKVVFLKVVPTAMLKLITYSRRQSFPSANVGINRVLYASNGMVDCRSCDLSKGRTVTIIFRLGQSRTVTKGKCTICLRSLTPRTFTSDVKVTRNASTSLTTLSNGRGAFTLCRAARASSPVTRRIFRL